jgi:hypothetical protein
VTEAWQESGRDWVTVYFAVSLVDYMDDSTGRGRGIDHAGRHEEYGDLHAPGRPEARRLSAIQTA